MLASLHENEELRPTRNGATMTEIGANQSLSMNFHCVKESGSLHCEREAKHA